MRLTSRLVHPNTIQIYDYGRTPEGIFFYAMEYLDGITLRELVRQEGALPPARVAHILDQVCASLGEAHRAGLIHRDVKPANVILCDRGGEADMAKVLDFGLVKSFRDGSGEEGDATRTLTVAGTPHFMSPESAADPEGADHRSDLYSVGALGYYLLAGRHVFEGRTSLAIIQQHARERPSPLRPVPGRPWDPGLAALLLGCLEKDPARRPQDAGLLRQALRDLATGDGWSEDRRREWWSRWRKQRDQARTEAPDPPAEPTLRIDLEDRT